MVEQEIRLVRHEGYAEILVDRPAQRNAVTIPHMEHMARLVDEVEADPAIHCLVFSAAGEKSFLSGSDISGLKEMGPAESKYEIDVGHRLFSRLERLAIPVVACINGYCLGGGLELAMSCDIRIASANAKFGLPEINIGVIPGWGGTVRLPHLIGEGRAKEMILRGRIITADTALEYGLVTAVYPTVQELRGQAAVLAAELAQKAPITMSVDKRLILDGRGSSPQDRAEADAFALAFVSGTEDTQEGLAAFLEKRKPNFKGR